jgi:hypothetical protein
VSVRSDDEHYLAPDPVNPSEAQRVIHHRAPSGQLHESIDLDAGRISSDPAIIQTVDVDPQP